MTDQPQTLADWDTASRAGVTGVFCDIDDTLTRKGRVGADVFAAMEKLQAAGLLVVPITGRPAGWCDLIARQWPVDAVVGENGAFYFRYDPKVRRMIRKYHAGDAERKNNMQALQIIARQTLKLVPAATVASDQPYRETDLAIDFAEDVGPLGREEIDKIVAVYKKHGATVKVSSIHVNGWYGDYDKLTMTKVLMADAFGIDLDASRACYAFVGDSPNDAPMFGFFPNSIGVANVADMLDQCQHPPKRITRGGSGDGFIEAVEAILAAKK
jgi:HAD superfamily hydrolase (TIGR01484 family)